MCWGLGDWNVISLRFQVGRGCVAVGMISLSEDSCEVDMRISEHGQITIPKHLRERFGMHHNVEVEVTPTDKGLLISKRVDEENPVDRVYGILGKDALGEGVSVDEYIEEIRGR